MGTEFLVGASAIAIASASVVGGTFLMSWLSEKDVLFTNLPEGTAKAIMRKASFDHFIASVDGKHLNDPRKPYYDPAFPAWEVLDNEEDVNYSHQGLLTHYAGIYFLGPNPFLQVKNYRFVWNEEESDEDGKGKLLKRDESTNFIYVTDFPYIIILDAAETSEGIPVDLNYQLIVRITNPFKALFGTEDWLKVVSAAANRCARSYVGSRTYKDLQSETQATEAEKAAMGYDPDKFSCPIIKLTHELPDDVLDAHEKGLSARYGVTLVSANPQTIALTGKNAAEYEKTTTERFTSDQKAYTIATLGKAEAETIKARGDAEASAIKAKGEAEAESLKSRLGVLNSAGSLGELMLQTDAMGANGPGKTIIWANDPLISAFKKLASGTKAD